MSERGQMEFDEINPITFKVTMAKVNRIGKISQSGKRDLTPMMRQKRLAAKSKDITPTHAKEKSQLSNEREQSRHIPSRANTRLEPINHN